MNGTYLRHMARLSHTRIDVITVGAALAAMGDSALFAAAAAPTEMPVWPGVSS
jgi:hypothetical protein